ncbi:hypothetical protein FLJC2902T_26950 [Flavobacterium limnosediminis JC2902]|uniref:Uncharacterized protein n=1 Tax=Flavobacterium limnosediminis JC2902 TaxID=1341181 RepID=V6SP88_9FLAO|nr:hypothetical protein [Flavobacterium limnosediminis]ESU26215.1 hypothetical protein FLJC2902T_26950 [Flavobacterium limnosediminis JC2902]
MIKLVVLLLAVLLMHSIAPAQNRKAQYKLDPYGQKLSSDFMDLGSKYPDNAMAFRITPDSGRVYQFNAPRYSAYKINYADFRRKAEELSGKTFSDSTIFIITYSYKDDACSDWFSNKMSRGLINRRKEHYDTQKRFIEKTYKNSVFLILFEEDIILSNNPKSKREYFYTDKDNFFRKTIFTNPTLCGSHGIIKPDGVTLIHNGEYRADWMAKHLKPEIWNSFFDSEQINLSPPKK